MSHSRPYIREHREVTFQASGEVWLDTDEPGHFRTVGISCEHKHKTIDAARKCADRIGNKLVREHDNKRKGK